MLSTKEQHTLKNQRQTEREIKPGESTPIIWKRNVSPHSREYCFLEGKGTNQFEESSSAFDIYKQIINLDLLIEILVQQSNLYLQQTWRKFLSNAWEMKVLIDVNYIMTVNQLSSITIFWDCNHFIGNVNIFARPRNQAVFDNNQFANNTKQNETKKAIKWELSMTQMNPFKQYVLMNI